MFRLQQDCMPCLIFRNLIYFPCFALMQKREFRMPWICQGDPRGSQMTPRWKSRAASQAVGGNIWKGGTDQRRNKKASRQYIGWMTVFQSVVAVCFTENLPCDKDAWVSVCLHECKRLKKKID